MASCIDIAQSGLSRARARPWIVARPMRTPVNEPGPRVTAKRSISCRSTPLSVRSQSTAGRSFSFRDERPSSATAPISDRSRSSATEKIGSEVSAARMSIANPSGRCLSGRGDAEVDQLDPDLLGDLARTLVAIELAVVDLLDPGVGDQL